ncbi:phosphoglucosamine mutase [Candidatus Thorarchaeota archaeon]|nr:MAG: phosphoglucosamine mutase [Candidatus Thorarchaeota archaeon]
MEKLFGTSGIRGSITEKVTPKLALDLGRSLGTFLQGRGKVGLGIDERTSNQMLKRAFVSGVLSTGVSVIDVGVAPMPTVASFSTWDGIRASIIITASHNPPTDNGFKFFVEGREFIRSEEVEMEKTVASGDFVVAEWKYIGSIQSSDIKNQYLNRIKEFIRKRGSDGSGAKILVDAANGAACSYTPKLLDELGFSVTTINAHADGYFPGRPAEPSPRNLTDIMQMMMDSDFAVGIAHDGDGDRIAIIDENGQFIDQNRIIAILAREEVERKGGGLVVVSIDTSSVIDELVHNAGGEIVRTALGSLQELLHSKKEEVVFASEPWKPIFSDLGLWMDGIAGAARICQLVDGLGNGSCMELMKNIPEYPILRENIHCPNQIKDEFIPHVKKLISPNLNGLDKVIEVDGIRFEFSNGSYLLIRVSGTEPKARLYVGGRSEQTVEKLADVGRMTMKQAVNDLS